MIYQALNFTLSGFLCVQADLLQSNNFFCVLIPSFIHIAVRTLTYPYSEDVSTFWKPPICQLLFTKLNSLWLHLISPLTATTSLSQYPSLRCFLSLALPPLSPLPANNFFSCAAGSRARRHKPARVPLPCGPPVFRRKLPLGKYPLSIFIFSRLLDSESS
uniref:Putative serine/threonine-protein kinase At1g54610 n=1 Tax=Rhizophora mucronata TaxID=61149 RepID=A0A2P2K3X2_RHIMU